MSKSSVAWYEDLPPNWDEDRSDALDWLEDPVQHKRESKPLYRVLGLPDERFERLAAVINESKSILELMPGWDEDAAKAIDKRTWERATEFLRGHALHACNLIGKCIVAPMIEPVSDGSIDLWWKNASGELLVNFPTDVDKPAEFYGDTSDGLHIKGTLDPSARNWGLVDWLTHF
jgi:hypothetical protein